VNEGLTKQSPANSPEDENLLYATMTHIRDVKLAMNALKLLFQPIRDQVALLKKHGVLLSEDKLMHLELGRLIWTLDEEIDALVC
jgi:dynein heavy chain